MSSSTFSHIHLHTEHSLLDGAIQVPELIKHLKDNNMTACAITDHGWMAGVVNFYKKMKAAGLKPLLGTEIYCTDDKDGLRKEEMTKDNYHMVLIAKDNIGLSRLMELVSNAALNNFYYKPRVYKEHLRSLGGHVVATSGCLAGIIAKRLEFTLDQYGRAITCVDPNEIIKQSMNFYKQVFGNDFYLELQVWNDNSNTQQIYNQWLLNFGREHNIPFVLTADCHYINQEDYKLHELLMAMQLSMTLEDYKQSSNMQYGPYFYVASPEEMMKRAESLGCIEAYTNTQEIVDKCNIELTLGKYKEIPFDTTKQNDYEEFLQWKKKQNDHII